MRVTFWGTRGSIPTPGPHTVRYGGNTPSAEVRTSAGTLMILDCGSGIRELGRHLLKDGAAPITGAILLSHAHWDHIQGFPFFGPLFLPQNQFTIYGPRPQDRALEAIFAAQMEQPYFPVRLSDLAARLRFHELEEETIAIGEARVRSHYAHHPTVCLAYRIEADGATLVYATDTEPASSYLHAPDRVTPSHGEHDCDSPASRLTHEADRDLVAFVAGADMLIMDAQYSLEEYQTKRGWGHSPLDYVMDVAIAAQVKRVVLFHHDPLHADTVVDSFEAVCRERARKEQPGLEVIAAREGMVLPC
ncbi:MAG: MBL fold metallo-hydrolase [Chloroflexi bacterium]|nr:MBL fold metallo-hydrolase [Chloroflexota bacterium]